MTDLTTPAGGLDLLERADPVTSHGGNDGDHDRFAHYVPIPQLEAAIFHGTPTVALCGKVWVPRRDPKRYPVCPDCKAIHEQLPPGDDDQG